MVLPRHMWHADSTSVAHTAKKLGKGVLIHIHHLHHLHFFLSFFFLFFASVEVGGWVIEFKAKIKDADGFCNSSTEVGSWLRDTSHLLMAPSIQSGLCIKCLRF